MGRRWAVSRQGAVQPRAAGAKCRKPRLPRDAKPTPTPSSQRKCERQGVVPENIPDTKAEETIC